MLEQLTCSGFCSYRHTDIITRKAERWNLTPYIRMSIFIHPNTAAAIMMSELAQSWLPEKKPTTLGLIKFRSCQQEVGLWVRWIRTHFSCSLPSFITQLCCYIHWLKYSMPYTDTVNKMKAWYAVVFVLSVT